MNLETIALDAYARANIDPEDPPGPHTHAELAGVAIRYDAGLCIGAAAYDSMRDIIWVRPGLAPHVEGLRIYHELAERELRGQVHPDHDELCDQLAFRLRMPLPAYRWLAHQEGPHWTKLARPWRASHVAAALRWGETTDVPTAVLTPEAVRFRGAARRWPGDLRALAERGSVPGARVDTVRGGLVVVAT